MRGPVGLLFLAPRYYDGEKEESDVWRFSQVGIVGFSHGGARRVDESHLLTGLLEHPPETVCVSMPWIV
jgi:hypothetical protein